MPGPRELPGGPRFEDFNRLDPIGSAVQTPPRRLSAQNPSQKESPTTATFGTASGVDTASMKTFPKTKQARNFKHKRSRVPLYFSDRSLFYIGEFTAPLEAISDQSPPTWRQSSRIDFWNWTNADCKLSLKCSSSRVPSTHRHTPKTGESR